MSFLLPFIILVLPLSAGPRDSISLVEADWHRVRLGRGAVLAVAQVEMFESRQSISYVRFPSRRSRVFLAPTPDLERTSSVGTRMRARFGINAGYWNVRTGIPSTYIRVDGKDVASTENRELHRVNGIIAFRGDSIAVYPCSPRSYADFSAREDNILAVGPVLLTEGAVSDFSATRPGFRKRHPRSVIGYDANGYIFMVAVDGRFPGEADGMTCDELAMLCRWMGMTDAINLDGGGSTTLWSRKTGVANHPCDNHGFDMNGERRVSSSILVR